MSNSLLFCTHNPSKIERISAILKKHDVAMLTPDDVELHEVDPTEHGQSFSEVAVNKWRDYAAKIDNPEQVLFVEDGGISVDALNGEPGIKSRRWKDGKTDMSDEECIAYILERLKDVPQGERTARYNSAIAYGKKGEKPEVVLGEVRGLILVEPRMHFMTPGFPYRTLFFVEGEDQMLAELEKRDTWQSHIDITVTKMLKGLGIVASQ